MAQTILCDAHNMEHPADWLVTHMEDGDARAYCDDGYRELMVSTVEAMNAAEIDQTDAEAERRLAAAQAPAGEAIDYGESRETLTTGEVAEREGPPPPPEVADRPGEPPVPPADRTVETEPAHIVRRGQSQRARQHQAAQELRAEREAATATATAEPGFANDAERIAALATTEPRELTEPDDDEDDDADAQEAATPPA